MNYFLFKFGFTFLIFAFIGTFLKADILIVFGTFFLASGIFLRLLSKKYRDFCFLFIAATLGFWVMALSFITEFYPAASLNKASAEIRGVVTEVNSGYGSPSYTVKTDYVGIKSAPQNITVKLSSWDDSFAEEYDRISCEVNFAVYDGTLDEILSGRSEKISIYAYAKTPITVTGEEHNSLGYYIFAARDKISSVIYEYFIDWHAPFMDELLIGNRGDLDYSVKLAFRRSGLSHILAISGTHLVIVIGLLEKILGYKATKPRAQRKISAVLVLATGLYMLLGGMGMSVLRAGFMLIIQYIVKIFAGNSKSLDSLGASVTVILLIDPLASSDIGFLMSVFACGAISVFSPPIKEYLTRIFKAENKVIPLFLIESFTAGAVGSFAVLPISAIVFGEISFIAPISNTFAAFFAQYAIIFGMSTVIFGLIPFLGFFAEGCSFLAMLCSGALLKIAEISAELPFAFVNYESLWLFIWLIGSVLIMVLPLLIKQNFRYFKVSVIMSTVVLVLGFLLNFIFYSGVSKIEISALEHGTAVCCETDGNSVLITAELDSLDRYSLNYKNYDYVFCLDSQSGAAELDLLRSTEPEKAFSSFDDVSSRYKGSNRFTLGKTELYGECYIDIKTSGVYALEIDNANILYVSEKFDIMDIEPKFRTADIIIFDGISPEEFPNLRCKYLIFTEKCGYFSGASEIIVLNEESVSFFAYGKNIKKGWDFN